MDVNFWMRLWQVVFVVGVGAFAVFAVWVTVGGFRDIGRLLDRLRDATDESKAGDEAEDYLCLVMPLRLLD